MRQVLRLFLTASFCLSYCAILLLAQTDRGTITGTVADATRAVIPGAGVTATNTQTSAKYETVSTETGNYTLTQLPGGVYEVTVELPGFKKSVRQGITVVAAATVRVDIALEVGAATDEITVNADAPLLRTESSELGFNVRTEILDGLPVFATGAAAGSSGIRNPTAVAGLLPGSYVVPNATVKINGAPGNTASYRVEGQDASNGQVPATQAQVQPSVDALQEITVLTSNFAAEYGQVGGGMFNYVVKSGTNDFHGTAYDYMVNESLNAAAPWVANNARPRVRRHDYGFTVGGPVDLGRIYDGHNKTFFFFNFEQFRDHQTINTIANTVPIQAYRDGDFSRAITGRNLGTDPLGRPIIEGTIYDPATTKTAPDGRLVRDPFLNNIIPVDRMDPVALKIQSMIPLPTNPSSLVNNGIYPFLSDRVTSIPAIKLDHNLGSKAKLSYYWSQTKTASQYSSPLGGADGLPEPVTSAIGTFITARVQRLNYDQTLSPTKLLHLGIGYQTNNFADDPGTTGYDVAGNLGLRGATVNRLFPSFQMLSNNQGGVKNLGPGNSNNRHPLLYEKPTGNASLTWVKDNHSYKFGAEARIEGNASTVYAYTSGTYLFSNAQTGLPYVTQAGGTIGGGTVGFPYASFLLGLAESVRIAPPNTIRLGKHSIGLFVQDSWKVTRKLTVDYGLRYDYQTYLKEEHGRLANFSPTTPNPTAGGLPGAVIFEGEGAGHCNCSFARNYPYAFGPRLGMAYQFAPKTVIRAGFGIVYSGTGDSNGATQGGLTAVSAVTSPGNGDAIMTLRNGIPFAPAPFPNFDPGQYPSQPAYAGSQHPLTWYDQNAGRPARQWQWSIGIQREFFQNFAVEASYVGNRGVWWNSPGLIDVNGLTPERLAAFGLDVTNSNDQALLRSTLGSATAAGRGFNKLPYAGYPTTLPVAQSLRPFPQFDSITSLWSPLGKTWYDSLQVKATKRFSHGLSFTSNFTWSKNLSMGAASNVVSPGTGNAPVNDVFNRKLNKYISQFDQPYVFNISLNYTMPALKGNKVLSWALRDWTIGASSTYASGLPILAPLAQNNLNSLLLRNATGAISYANRVPDQPLFQKDLNCHCFDPNKEFVLNPAAWADPAQGTFGNGAAYYNDYRYQRQPQENLAIGRTFRFGERVSFNVRTEFTNIFNRSRLPNPTSTNAKLTQTPTPASGHVDTRTTAGFGFVNTAVAPSTPASRQGQIVARLTF